MTPLPPMLAKEAILSELTFPVFASPKIDAIRCTIYGGVAYSRSLKPLPNRHIQEMVKELPDGLDGELAIGDITAPDLMGKSMSVIMSHSNPIDELSFNIFDYVTEGPVRFSARLFLAQSRIKELRLGWVKFHEHVSLNNLVELEQYEWSVLEVGYEGLILRNPEAPYKHGRSTVKSQGMLKVKRFSDSEAEVIGFEQFMHNSNEAQENELGKTKRSSAREGLVPLEKLGSFKVRDIHNGWEFNVGTKLTEANRVDFWENRDRLLGKLLKYSYFPHGMVNVPRHPKFLGFRDKRDL